MFQSKSASLMEKQDEDKDKKIDMEPADELSRL